MLKIAFDPIYAHPLPEGHRFPMLKYELIPLQLKHEGIIRDQNIFSPEILDEQWICPPHEKTYWEKLKNLNLTYQEEKRTGFPLSAQLVERELRIAQGTIDCCHFTMNFGVAFNVAGGTHHAGSNWGEGFCLLNDQAIAANYLLEKGLAKSILIIDLDVHQGNGTAQIFENNPQVFTFSVHGEKNFPFRKEKSDLDIGLADGVGDQEYLQIISEQLAKLFDQTKPDFVFFLSGVDVLASDKLGKLALTIEGCKQRDFLVFEACKKRNIPVQVSMGGGYSADIKIIVDAHCNTYKVANELYF
ncbi:deacetylase [Pedobacter psychrophilus]|uniref:Deacetylase n=1 Tax=Pedobacter psychrophilus TaxID=1826909 RepID=A0A179DN03_9SPHI|nr:histone deacetylase [Pedobacter psychrophilus]OAQ42172.1 deacetylase [Pedobacter psychrophilus]